MDACLRQRDRDQAVRLSHTALAFAATQNEEANENFQEVMQNLMGEDDPEIAYLLNPDAAADLEALRRAGMQPTPKEEPTNG